MTHLLVKSALAVTALATGSALLALRGTSDGGVAGESIAAHLTAPPGPSSIWVAVRDTAFRDSLMKPDSTRRDTTIRRDSTWRDSLNHKPKPKPKPSPRGK